MAAHWLTDFHLTMTMTMTMTKTKTHVKTNTKIGDGNPLVDIFSSSPKCSQVMDWKKHDFFI